MDRTSLTRAEEDLVLNIAARIQRNRSARESAIEEEKATAQDWRILEPTEKQVKILREHGYDTKVTRGQASEIIDRIFKEDKKP